ncbi:hypothetical protein GVv1_23060 [Enterobacter pseudoroggenkampii]
MHIGTVGFDAQATQKMGNSFLRLGSRKFSNIAHDPSSSLAFVLTLLYPQIQPVNALAYARKQQKDDKLKTTCPPKGGRAGV